MEAPLLATWGLRLLALRSSFYRILIVFMSEAVILAPTIVPLSPFDNVSFATALLDRGPMDARF